MKKVVKLLFSILIMAVILSGCGAAASSEEDASVIRPEAIGDPFLAKLLEAIDAAGLNSANISVNGMMYSDPQSVHVTKELLSDIGKAIISGNPMVVEPPAKSATNFDQHIIVQFIYGDDKYAGLNIFAGTEQQPERALMWMQLDSEWAEYSFDNAAFEMIQRLILAQTFPKELFLEGAYVRSFPARAEPNKIYLSGLELSDVLEIKGKLFLLWHDEDGNWVEEINPKTGEAAVVWEQAALHEWDYMRLEHAAYGEFDYRVKGDRVAVYRNSGDPTVSQVFDAPADAIKDRSFSFDIQPETGYIVYSADGGVYAGYGGGKWKRLLDNNDLETTNYSGQEDMPAYYGEVHLLNGGRQIASVAIYPASQSGRQALALVDAATGKATSFEGLFSAMVADVRYIDDKTVAAVAMDQVTMIDAESKQVDLLAPFDAQASTYDFRTFFILRREKDEAGLTNGVLLSYPAGDIGQDSQLLRVVGDNIWISKVTDSYVILMCRDSREAFIALVPQ